jgi:imidazolonepropionase-like amidohydrolase
MLRRRLQPHSAACGLLLGLLLSPATLRGQNAGMPAGPTVVRAARMLDVVAGRIVPNATVVIEGDRITAVNPASPPRGARVIDLGDVTLMPGFVDLHTHLAGGELSAASFTEPVTATMADASFLAAKHAETTLMAGFTTVRDFGGDVTVALGKAAEGRVVPSPHVVPSRHALGITGGHCDVTGFAPGIAEQGVADGVADGPWEVVQAVRYQIKHGAQVIKTCATAGVLSMEGPVGAQQYSYDELKAMVDEAARHGIKVAAHAHGTEGIKAAIRAGVASIEHGSMLDDEAIRMMKEQGTWLVPTTYLADRIDLDALPPLVRMKAESVLPLARESLRQAIAAGVPIAFGTDAGVFPHGENAREFAVYVRLGMSPADAIRTATVNAAQLLGKDDRGIIEAGRLADLIAVPGNPLADITATERVTWVMFAGRVVKEGENGRRPATEQTGASRSADRIEPRHELEEDEQPDRHHDGERERPEKDAPEDGVVVLQVHVEAHHDQELRGRESEQRGHQDGVQRRNVEDRHLDRGDDGEDHAHYHVRHDTGVPAPPLCCPSRLHAH